MQPQAVRPIDHLTNAYHSLVNDGDLDEKQMGSLLDALKDIPSTRENLAQLTLLRDRVGMISGEKGHLKDLLEKIKLTISPLLLYSPSEPQASYFGMPTWNGLGMLPYKIVDCYYNCLVDGKGPWREVFDLSLAAMKKVITPQLYHTIEQETLVAKTMEIMALLNSDEEALLRYPKIFYSIREAAALPAFQAHPNHACVQYITRLCYNHWAELQLHPFFRRLILPMLNEGKKQTENVGGIADILNIPLEQQFRYMQAAPQHLKAPLAQIYYNRFCWSFNINSDSHCQTNIPWVLYDFFVTPKEGAAKAVRVLRMGSPTFQRTSFSKIFESADLVIEFKLFINYLISIGKRVLFFSHQDETEGSLKTEYPRNSAQKNFFSLRPHHIFYGILTHDTPFYHQKGDFVSLNEAGAFKKRFLEELLGNKTGFYFSENLVNSELRDLLADLMNSLHYVLFKDKEDLSVKERCCFIQIFYVFMAIKLVVKTSADFLIFCCRDSADRANLMNAICQYVILILYDKEMSLEHLRILEEYIHAAALIVKQQEMNFRNERLLWSLELLQDPEVRSRIKARRHLLNIIGNDIRVAK